MTHTNIDSIMGRVIKVKGMHGISWYVPYQSTGSRQVKLTSIPLGQPSEEASTVLLGWVKTGHIEASARVYESWAHALGATQGRKVAVVWQA